MKIALQYSAPEQLRFEDDGSIPNNPKLPLLLYRLQSDPGDRNLAPLFEDCFESNAWKGCWRNGIYPYHHYHSLSHEVLGVYGGEATLQLGGKSGTKTRVKRGDVLVIPAGTGHKKLEASADFGVVGAYPEGQEYDTLRGGPGDRPQALENISKVSLPSADPIMGSDGGLRQIWA